VKVGKIINNHGKKIMWKMRMKRRRKKRPGQAVYEITRFSKCVFYHSTRI